MKNKIKKDNKLTEIATKPFDFSDEIQYLLRYKKFIPAFILSVIKLETHCYYLVDRLKNLLGNNFKMDGKKDLKSRSFGNLIEIIFVNNKESRLCIDCSVLCELKEINKLRNKVVHHTLKDIDIRIKELKIETQKKCNSTNKLWNKIWREYTNNSKFSNFVKSKRK